MIPTETDCPVRLKITVCKSDASIVTIDKGNDDTHRAVLQPGQVNRLLPPEMADQLTAFNPIKNVRLIEEDAYSPDAYFLTHRRSAEVPR
jgi:hypothetical protein